LIIYYCIAWLARAHDIANWIITFTRVIVIDLKKDKATVLANTTEYMNKLIAEVSELDERNRRLEAQLGLPGATQQTPSDDDPSERVAVDVTNGASTSSSTSCQPQEVSIRVTVRAECDLSEVVVAMLARIKEMGRFTVVTVDARQRSSAHAQVGITLRATVRTQNYSISVFKYISVLDFVKLTLLILI